ncbi:exodeoxyribonuclease VII small subunit [Halomonas piscis]|uniref:Exodeoxyribonuclease 7 small subunit n=1 Tax=Halomonas piscis TaxID=3031727 RepID=A0ABY9Z2F7_9GAMM|nr:exodeoxyribonuclease VII small subunit [Halomonas piscis]WNK20464.1 exodeoxyribonuclease VII small subunit [Halomonas piscis]
MSDTPSPTQDFATTIEQLEALVERLESGTLSLEDSLTAFEQGVGLARRAQTRLDDAELKVRALSENDAGGLSVTPFQPSDAGAETDADADNEPPSEETPPW